MARLILETGDGAGDIGNSIDVDVIGTNAAETIRVSNNARGTFDGSFTRGNDIIYIDGNAANYSIRQTGPNQVVITNATGANLVIPVGTGVTIQFADVTVGRVLSFNSSNAIVLGSQTITATASTITAGTPGSTGGNELFLVVAQDVLVGTAAADTFVADLIQNPLGEQTNSLGTGDRLTGGDGTDTLEAHLQDASALNAGPGSAIAPITSGVEVIYVTADQAFDRDGDSDPFESEDGITLGVEVNARRMTGVTDLGSVFSDTSMTYYNVNTLSTGATIGDETSARRTGAMTVRMERTGASTPNNDAANLTVLFDNDYLRPDDSVTTGAALRIQMMDLDAAIRDAPTRPLLNNPYTSFIFRVGDQTVSVPINENSETYAALLADFQAALAANPITAGKVTAAFGGQFRAFDTDLDPGGSQLGTEIVLTNSGPEVLTPVQFIAANGVPTDLDFHLQTTNEAPDTTDRLIEVNVELDKVGNGGDLGNVADDPEGANSTQVTAGGGYLTVGGMQTDDEHYEDSILNNTWKNGAIANPGVEQFNIVLEGNAIEDSSLAGIQSTHNALRVINLVNPGSTADIIVGNSNTRYATDVNGAVDDDSDGTTIDVSDVRNNGGDGTDTLEAHLQDASALNAGPGSAIAPITSGVEVIYVTADQAFDRDGDSDPFESEDGITLGVEVNARRMTGVTDLGSVFSDTSMTYYNVNTLSTGATIGDETSARRTGAMTVRMERTGASTPNNDAANLTVLFDNDYLRPDDSVTTGAALRIQMMDLDAAIRDAPTRPLLNNPYTSFIFRVGDQTVSVPINENSETYASTPSLSTSWS